MPVTEIGDPRLQALFGEPESKIESVRPTVRLPGKGVPTPVLVMGGLILAVLLFLALNSRRTAQTDAATAGQPPPLAATTSWDAPAPLYIPPAEVPGAAPLVADQDKPAPPAVVAPAPVVRSVPAPMTYMPAPGPQMMPLPVPAPPPQQRTSSGAPLVVDASGQAGGAGGSAAASSGITTSTQPLSRMRASGLANRSMTVPQGYLIQAVLETAFDSTKPGYARAIVSRDVRGFDGKNILIPRGSRLTGEYQSLVAPGQNRAVISWTRLIRPDGMTIAMDSPAVDTLGRGGVAASVNTHFFARLGDALLQTTFQLGSMVGSRAVTGPVVVLPNATTNVGNQIVQQTTYVPTLTVPPGKSISIFVAHDLDFSAAGAGR